MRQDLVERVVSLAGRTGFTLVATAGRDGMPHLAVAGRLGIRPDGRLEVDSWFCPGTVANLDADRRVSLTAWDPAADIGWQVLGEVEETEVEAVMDGWSPALADRIPMPQVERRLLVRVERVLDFSRAPHTDIEEPAT